MTNINLIKDINKLYHVFYDGNALSVNNITNVKECKRLADNIKNNPKDNHSQEIKQILSYLKQTNKALNKIPTNNKDPEFTKTKQRIQNIINKILTND